MTDQEFEREIKLIERKSFCFAVIGMLVLMLPVFWAWYETDPLFK